MKTVMLLLVLVVGMLLSPVFAMSSHRRPEHSLKHIMDLAGRYNASLTKEIYAEDVSYLAEGSEGCGNKFFCRVHEILEHHAKKHGHTHKNVEMELVKTLRIYIDITNVNCTETLTNVTRSEETKPIPVLVNFLDKCSQHRNMKTA